MVPPVSPHLKIEPYKAIIGASAALLIISALALGFIFASSDSTAHVVASINGNCMPFVALGGISFVILSINLVRFKWLLRELEKKQENDFLNAQRKNTEVPEESVTPKARRTFTPSLEPSKTASKLAYTYGSGEEEALRDRLRPTPVVRRSIAPQELFDVSNIVLNKEYQRELNALRESSVYVLNKLALFIETFIRSDYYIHNGYKESVAHETTLAPQIHTWDKAIIFVRDQIVQDIFDILQGNKQISSAELLSYFLNFNQNVFFPLGKMKTIAVRRMVTAHNFGSSEQAEKTMKTREAIDGFFTEFQMLDPKNLKSLEDLLLYLTLSPFDNPPEVLRTKAALFFKLLLTANTASSQKDVVAALERCKSHPKKGNEFLFLQILFQVKKGDQEQAALKQAFDAFFEEWIVILMKEIKEQAGQFFKVLGLIGLPIMNRFIEEDGFEGDKLKAVMGLLIHLSTFNSGILKDVALAQDLVAREMALNFARDADEQVVLVKGDQIPAPILKAQKDEVVRQKGRVDQTVQALTINGAVFKPYFLPFLTKHLKQSTKVQAKGAFKLVNLGIGLIGVEWMMNFLRPVISPVYNGMLAKTPEQASWYQNSSPFRHVFTSISVPSNNELSRSILKVEEVNAILLSLMAIDQKVFNIIHDYTQNDYAIPLEEILAKFGHHLTKVKKSLYAAIPK